MVIIGDLPEIVDYEVSGYDRSSGSLYQIEVYLMDIYSDDNPHMHVDFTCCFLYGGQPSPIADQTEINQIFRLNKISLAEFPDVIQWLTDAEDVPCEAGGLAVRLVTRDLILDCPRARSVVAILTVNFVGWDYLHSDRVDDDLAERVAAAVAKVMGVGRTIARDLAAASVAEAMDRRRPAAKAAVDALERFVIRDLEAERRRIAWSVWRSYHLAARPPGCRAPIYSTGSVSVPGSSTAATVHCVDLNCRPSLSEQSNVVGMNSIQILVAFLRKDKYV